MKLNFLDAGSEIHSVVASQFILLSRLKVSLQTYFTFERAADVQYRPTIQCTKEPEELFTTAKNLNKLGVVVKQLQKYCIISCLFKTVKYVDFLNTSCTVHTEHNCVL